MRSQSQLHVTQDYHAALEVTRTWGLQHDLPERSWILHRAGFSPSTDMVRYFAITWGVFSSCPHELDSPTCLLRQLPYTHDFFVSSWSRSALAVAEDHKAPLEPIVIAPHALRTMLSSFDM